MSPPDRDGKDAEKLLIHCLTAGLSAPRAVDRTLWELGYPTDAIAKFRPNVSGDKPIRESLAISAQHLDLQDDRWYREPNDDEEGS